MRGQVLKAAVAIDADECRDSQFVGAKAARLAQARAAGLTVPDSIVVPCAASEDMLASAIQDVESRGVHACRLDVMAADRSAFAALVPQAGRLGPALAVRSSAPLEDDPQLAGAYSSLIGVCPDEVPTAVLAVWASAIRGPGPAPRMGVLIQPELMPAWAGTAALTGNGSVEVVAARGAGGALTAGLAAGVTATVSPTGEIAPAAAPAAVGEPVLHAAAALARDVGSVLGDDLIEWAFQDGRTWLLQSRRAAPAVRPMGYPGAVPRPLPPDGQLIVRAVRCAGDLAERWVLPWAVAWDGRPAADETPRPQAMARPEAAWETMTRLSDRLTSQVWDTPPAQAVDVAARLRSLRQGGGTALARRLTALTAPDPRQARQCLRLCARLAAHLVAVGVIASPGQFWALPADLAPVLRGGDDPPDAHRSGYQAALSWEPLLYSAAEAGGTRFRGVPASPGMGCGPGIPADDAVLRAERQPGAVPPRAVIVARYPLPRYSPLLMSAAGLVAHGGSGAAHLVTVARSLGVPVVLGCDLSATARPGTSTYVAVDGAAGTVSVLTLG